MAESSNSPLDVSAVNPDKKLAISLKEALDTVIKKTIREIKFSVIKKSYKEIFDASPESLKKLQEEIVNQLKENVTLEISKICEDENIETLLNSLNDIILQNAEYEGQVAWRPSGNPSEDIRDHLYESKLKHKAELDKILKDLNEENEMLSEIVEKNHCEILQTQLENEKLICDFKKNVNVYQDGIIDAEQSLLSIPLLPDV